MHKKLLQAWISKEALKFMEKDMQSLKITNRRKYILYLLKERGYEPDFSEI